MITVMLGGIIFFAAGVRWWEFVLVLVPVPFAARYAYHHLHVYQRARIDTFMSPESDPLGAGYNIIHQRSLWVPEACGQGIFAGTQGHLDFLPEKADGLHLYDDRAGIWPGRRDRVITLLIINYLGRALLIALRCKEPILEGLSHLALPAIFFFYCFVNIAMVWES